MYSKTGIGEHGRLNVKVLDEPSSLFRGAVADDHQLSAGAVNAGDVVAQLRDLLFAKESAEVPYEREHHRLLRPKIDDLARLARCVKHFDLRQSGDAIHDTLSFGHDANPFLPG